MVRVSLRGILGVSDPPICLCLLSLGKRRLIEIGSVVSGVNVIEILFVVFKSFYSKTVVY